MAKKIVVHITLVTVLSLLLWFFGLKGLALLVGVEWWELGVVVSTFVILVSIAVSNIGLKMVAAYWGR
jgi:hypothetical protein